MKYISSDPRSDWRDFDNSGGIKYYFSNLVKRHSEIYVVSGNFVAGLYTKIIQHVSYFTNRV